MTEEQGDAILEALARIEDTLGDILAGVNLAANPDLSRIESMLGSIDANLAATTARRLECGTCP